MFKPPLVDPKAVQLKLSACAKEGAIKKAKEKMHIANKSDLGLMPIFIDSWFPRSAWEREATGEFIAWMENAYKALEFIISPRDFA